MAPEPHHRMPLYRSDEAPGATDFCRALPPEIDFLVAEGVAQSLLAQAASRAKKQGVTAESLLLAEGLIDEGFYYRALARRLGCPCVEGAVALAPGFDYRAALRANVARADPRQENFDWLFSPRGAEIGPLLSLAGADEPNRRIAICPPRIFSALVRATGRHAYADDASLALLRADERLSARAPQLRRSGLFALIFSAALLIGVGALPLDRLDLASFALSAIFLGGILVRLCAMAASCLTRPDPPPPLPNRALRRRGFSWRSPQWLLFPLYLLLISLATWRALWEWARHPFVWNKTEHVPRQAAEEPSIDELSSDLRNLPAKASAIKARVLSMP